VSTSLSLPGSGSVNMFPRQRKLVGGVSSMQFVWYKRKTGDQFFLQLLFFFPPVSRPLTCFEMGPPLRRAERSG
jgi:hypothetical protein